MSLITMYEQVDVMISRLGVYFIYFFFKYDRLLYSSAVRRVKLQSGRANANTDPVDSGSQDGVNDF